MAATTTLNNSTDEVTHNAKVLRPIRRAKTTKEMFEDFYHKDFFEINEADLGDATEIDWGEDVCAEVMK